MSPSPPKRRQLRLPESDQEISLLEWPGDGPLILLHHANGFCAALWGPVAEALEGGYRVVALDARGHGESTAPKNPEAYRWGSFVDDLAGVAERLVDEAGETSIATMVGHSFGGTSALAAAARHPELFERLLLVEPIVLAPRPELDPDQPRRRRALAAGARRRRDVFASRAEARESWARHGFFASWDRRVLELYIEEGLRERADGQVELKCSKEIEANIFERSGSLDLFALAPQVRAPVLILWAVHGSFPRPVYETLAARLPRALVEDIDAGHLAPMECPERIARTLRAFVHGSA